MDTMFGFLILIILAGSHQVLATFTDSFTTEVVTEPTRFTESQKTKLLTACSLRPVDEDIHRQVVLTLARQAKLIEYRVILKDYSVNPLEVNNTWSYKTHLWARVGSGHGQTILNLAFNYGVLSLMTLSFGVLKMDVEFEDIPMGCLGKLNEQEKIDVTLDILLRDLQYNGSYVVEEGHSVCHQVIKTTNGYAKFTDRCCYRNEGEDVTICGTDLPNRWLEILEILLSVLTVFVFLFGPVMIPPWIYNVTSENIDYVVKLKESLYKTLAVSRSGDPSDYYARRVIDLRNKQTFVNCRRIIGELPSDTIIPIKISQFDIVVNYQKILRENHVPVSLTQSTSRALFLCKLRELDPFVDCCDANVLSFMGKRVKPLKWISVCNFVGKILLVICLPLPYYIRLAVYYMFEDPEIRRRQKAANNVGLSVLYNHRVIQYLTPTHPIYLAAYVLYFSVGFTMAYLSVRSVKTHFQQVIIDSFGDIQDLSWLKAVGMLMKNCLWPFKKFGMSGILIGIIWWPIIIPVSLVACVVYCLPMVFLSCRIVLHTLNASTQSTLPKGVKKFEADAILETLRSNNNFQKTKKNCYCSINLRLFVKNFLFICLALSTIYAVMAMFTEVIIFMAEILIFTFMGLIVNASKVLKYGTLIFLVVIYSYDTYNNVNKRYLKLNKALFSEIKGKLGKDIEDFTSLPSHLQGNRGFKTEEASEQADYEGTDDISSEKEFNWDINDLVLFIDSDDNPRIPKKLFDEVCQINVPGSPGPVYRSLMEATGKFLAIVFFILFIFIVVMSFGEAYKMSSTNQMLATMAGGFAPFLFRHVLRPASSDIETNLVSFRSKLGEIIKNFSQNWPMCDFVFDIEDKPDDDEDKDDNGGDTKEEQKDDKCKNGDKPTGAKHSKSVDKNLSRLMDYVDSSCRHTVETSEHDHVHIWNELLNSLKTRIESMDLKSAAGQCVDILVHVQDVDQEWLMELSSVSDLRHDYTPEGTVNDLHI